MKSTKLFLPLMILMTIQVSCMEEYVDLGLPSGTLWATCNVGADNPEDYGDYFAWGETTTKTFYEWATYKYVSDDNHKLTKYCDRKEDGYRGFSDKLTSLESSDDAASVNWSSRWCMPTEKQFRELKEKCVWKWTKRNGKEGYEVSSPNGNSIFLPAAGYKGPDGFLAYDGFEGRYWSSSLVTYSSFQGGCFEFSSGSLDFYSWRDRCFGFQVRPVRSK